MINNYAILAKKSYSDGYYYVMGYKTLRTLRKHYKNMIEKLKDVPHDKIILVSRDYHGDIIKVYESEV